MTESIKARKKICLIGPGGVGKTSLIKRFILNIFDDKYLRTLGTKVSKKVVNLEFPEKELQVNLTMMVWDIMGQESFRPILQDSYFFGTEGCLAVCDSTNVETMEALDEWVASLHKIAKDAQLIILANKSDLSESQVVDKEKLETFASRYNAPCFFTSAKTGDNVEKAFYELGKLLSSEYLV